MQHCHRSKQFLVVSETFILVLILLTSCQNTVGVQPSPQPPTATRSLISSMVTTANATVTPSSTAALPTTTEAVVASTPTTSMVATAIPLPPTEEGIPVSPFRRNQLVYRPTYRVEPSSVQGWNQVTNLEYGFTFRYPARLQLTISGNFVWVALENANLFFGFHRPDEPVSFNYIKNEFIYYLPGNGGNPDVQGEVIPRGALEIKGLQISRSAVRISNRDWFVLYNEGEEFEVKKVVGGTQVGRLLLSGIVESTISPNDPPGGYMGITPAEQALTDQIIATFDFQTYAFSGWQTYSDPDFGLSFEYPTEWQATMRWEQAQPYGSSKAIMKREEFFGPGGMIDLDIWDAHNLKIPDWQNWWHEWTGAPREGFEPEKPNAKVFRLPAILYVEQWVQAYDDVCLFFTDGKYIYRLMYIMQDRRVGLEAFFRMVNTLKSNSLGPADPVLPTLDID